MFQAAHDAEGLAAYLATFHARMYDVSAFMKLVKQRFTQWYNRRVGRKGTLWEDRFRSVLVEGAGDALVTMAAYIDLNPVRAG
ncbi:MAG: transposase, partial [Limisphaerales bacterium]